MCKCKTGVPYPNGHCDNCGCEDKTKAIVEEPEEFAIQRCTECDSNYFIVFYSSVEVTKIFLKCCHCEKEFELIKNTN